MRHWTTGLGTGWLIVLTCLSVQAQSEEQHIDTLESKIAEMTKSLPSWVQRFTFEGDLRLRYQYEETTGEEERNRGRLRYRLGVAAKVTEQSKAVFGLASGGDDPRSTKQTFQDTFFLGGSTNAEGLDVVFKF